MRKFFIIAALTAILVAIYICPQADAAGAAKKSVNGPAAIAGDTVTTDYFSLKIPVDWMMPQPVKKRKEGISAVFFNRGGLAVTINVIEMPISAQDLAERTVTGMRKDKFEVGKTRKVGDLYAITLKNRDIAGEAWFGGNGRICAATVILGGALNQARPLLQAIKSPDRKLFPGN